MLSISKNGSEFKGKSGKRLAVFSKITGILTICEPTRNLLIKGLDPFINFQELEALFKKFGDLYILDTQNLAHSEVIVSYFDIRISKLSYSYFSIFYPVHFLPDPPFEEFSDILYINLTPIPDSFLNPSPDFSATQIDSNTLALKFFDLRKYWSTISLLDKHSLEEIDKKTTQKGFLCPDEKENQPPIIQRKPENLMKFVIDVEGFWDKNDFRTTLMIKNIPNKYTQTMLLESVNKNHAFTFDFMYLPIDFKNKCNVGYAFINFVDYRFIPSFYKEFDGKKWEKFNSEKVCALSYARIQGRLNLEKHFQSSSIMGQDLSMRPVILSNFNNI